LDRIGLLVAIILALMAVLVGMGVYTTSTDQLDDWIERGNDSVDEKSEEAQNRFINGCEERCEFPVEKVYQRQQRV